MARTSDRHRLLDYWVGVPMLALASRLRPRRPIPDNAKRIGIFCPTAIGDLILDSGMLVHLRQVFPFASIHLFCGPTNAGVVPLLPVDVQVHCCDFKRLGATVAAIRRAQLDIVIDLTPWPRDRKSVV